jgi:hypothetical protein
MSRLWKDFRTNLMYWRFRHITRNRLRVQSWWNRRRQPAPTPYRPRASATYVYPYTNRRSWIAFFALVILLTALTVLAKQVFINPTIVYGIGALIVVGTIYWAMRGI